LQLAPEQVNKITVAKELGKLSLAVRAAVEQQDTGDTATIVRHDVSPEIARPSATVVGYARDKAEKYALKLPGNSDER
jgi:Flp pilus assembly protein CpaB